jgi:hypothetical protein
MLIRAATKEDNQALLALARQAPMDAKLVVNIDRSPDYFRLAGLQGNDPLIFVAEKEEKLIGAVGISFRDVYLKGEKIRIGYIGGIKIDHICGNSFVAFRLMKHVAEYLSDTPVKFGVILVMGENKAMNALLSGRAGIPPFDRIAGYRVKYLFPFRFQRSSRDYTYRHAIRSDIPRLSELFRQFYDNYELAPRWNDEYLLSLYNEPDYKLENTWLATDCKKIFAVVALWNQSEFKNTIISRYAGKYSLLYNTLRPFGLLPPAGWPLSEICIRHLVFDKKYPDAARYLIQWILKHQTREYRFVRFGFLTDTLHEQIISKFCGISIPVNLYCAFRPNDPDRELMVNCLQQSLIWEDLSLH